MKVIIDRFSYRPVAVVCHVMAAVGVVTTSFVPNMPLVYLTYSLMFGCGAGGLTILALGLVVHYFPSKNIVRGLAFSLSGTSIGMLSFAPFIRFLFDRFGWRHTLQIIGSMYFTIGIPCIATMVPPSSENERSPCAKDQRTDENMLTSKVVRTSIGKIDDRHHDPGPPFPQDETGRGADLNKRVLENHIPEVVGADGNIPGDKLDKIRSDNSRRSLLEGDARIKGWQRRITCYPELCFISVAVFINGVADSFYYVNMVSYMVSLGFTENDGALFLSILGRQLPWENNLSLVGEWLPFPVYYTMGYCICGELPGHVLFSRRKEFTIMLILAAGEKNTLSILFIYNVKLS
nr:monocarboxylate transporter 9-like [Lytechinus pictus]